MGLMPVAGAENPLGMTLTRQLPASYNPGGTVEVRLTLALRPPYMISAPWAFMRPCPPAGPSPAWMERNPKLAPAWGIPERWNSHGLPFPRFPCTFTYVLNVPANAQGTQNFTGQIEYREQGAALFSEAAASTLEATVLLQDAEALRDGFTQADQDASGTLSFEEASAFVPGISQIQFNALDADGDGAVTLAELNAYIEANTSVRLQLQQGGVAFSKDWFKRSLGDLFLAD